MVESASTVGMWIEKKAVVLNSIYAAIGITAPKVIVGTTTGSLGILSEAAHSGLDLGTTPESSSIVLFGSGGVGLAVL